MRSNSSTSLKWDVWRFAHSFTFFSYKRKLLVRLEKAIGGTVRRLPFSC